MREELEQTCALSRAQLSPSEILNLSETLASIKITKKNLILVHKLYGR